MIFSTHPLHPEVTAALEALGDYRVASAPTPEAIDAECRGAEVLVVRAPIAPGIVTRETGLRACVRHGAGLDMVPMEACTAAGVLVANVPGANAVTVAEHAIWSALALLRRFPQVRADLRKQGWEAARRQSNAGRELSGRTVGILGFGNIGREVARIARHGFGCEVIAQTRTPSRLPEGVEGVSLDDLLRRADVLVLCCPLTKETRGLIDAKALAAIRPGAVLLNVSRGPVTEEAALIEALTSGNLGGAALDVFGTQPLPPDHPFMTLDNVVLTPHMAGITEESMLRMGQGAAEEVARILRGEKPHNFCNPDAWDAYRQRFP